MRYISNAANDLTTELKCLFNGTVYSWSLSIYNYTTGFLQSK